MTILAQVFIFAVLAPSRLQSEMARAFDAGMVFQDTNLVLDAIQTKEALVNGV